MELLAKGALTNVADSLGQTPLHYATKRGDTDVVEALLDSGALPNVCPFYTPYAPNE